MERAGETSCAYCLISVSHPAELRFVLPLHTQSTLIFFYFCVMSVGSSPEI